MFIGPWSLQTRRQWLWLEWRYETLYTVPEIALVEDYRIDSEKLRHPRKYHRLTYRKAPVKKYKDATYLAVHPVEEKKRANLPWHEWIPLQIHSLKSKTRTWARECLTSLTSRGGHRPEVNKEDDEEDDDPYALRVKWLHLLEALHDLCKLHRASDCSCHVDSERTIWDDKEFVNVVDPVKPAALQQHLRHEAKTAEQERTTVAVIYRKRSWDLVPPDVSRPLALSRVGDIMILALRLGMTWHTLDPAKKSMSAEGNGCSITSLDIRGAGIVLSYERPSNGSYLKDKLYIPSTYCDGLMCGVLRPCPQLIPDDKLPKEKYLRMVSWDLKSKCDVLMDCLEIDRKLWDGPWKPHFNELRNSRRLGAGQETFRRTAFNDLIFLILPFLPLPNLSAIRVQFCGFAGMNPMSVFNYWEARMALIKRVKARVPVGTHSGGRLEEIRTDFVTFEKDFGGDFHMKKEDAAILGATGEGVVIERRPALLRLCRSVHQKTTQYFLELQPTSDGKNPKGHSLRFVDMLAAHWTIAAKAAAATRDIKNRDWDKYWKEHDYSVEGEHAPGYRGISDLYNICTAYVDHVEKGELWEVLKDKCTLSKEKLEEAWWMLMLRGLSFGMSVKFDAERPVSSWSYADPTPVYLT